MLARPLGAFIHFRKEPPAGLDPLLFGRFALLPQSFARSEQDPLQPLRSLPEPARTVVLEEFRCTSCHRLRGAGARAGHLRATDGGMVGGFALALEDYPPVLEPTSRELSLALSNSFGFGGTNATLVLGRP